MAEDVGGLNVLVCGGVSNHTMKKGLGGGVECTT